MAAISGLIPGVKRRSTGAFEDLALTSGSRVSEVDLLAGGVPLWAVSPLVVFPPAVFGGCPPPVPLSRVAASSHVSVS